MNKKAFTIIEVCVVFFLIWLMITGLKPYVKIVRMKARQVACERNLQKISLALRVYAYENDGKVPEDISFLITKGYINSERVFDCPYSPHKGTAKDPDYIYNPKFNFGDADNIPIVRDKDGNHPEGGANVLYLNGEIRGS